MDSFIKSYDRSTVMQLVFHSVRRECPFPPASEVLEVGITEVACCLSSLAPLLSHCHTTSIPHTASVRHRVSRVPKSNFRQTLSRFPRKGNSDIILVNVFFLIVVCLSVLNYNASFSACYCWTSILVRNQAVAFPMFMWTKHFIVTKTLPMFIAYGLFQQKFPI